MILAEPIDVEDLRRRFELCADIDPMCPVVAEVIAGEGQHGHRVAAHDTHRVGGRGGGLRSDSGTHEYAVQPIACLIYERGQRAASSAEYDGGDGYAARCIGQFGIT